MMPARLCIRRVQDKVSRRFGAFAHMHMAGSGSSLDLMSSLFQVCRRPGGGRAGVPALGRLDLKWMGHQGGVLGVPRKLPLDQ